MVYCERVATMHERGEMSCGFVGSQSLVISWSWRLVCGCGEGLWPKTMERERGGKGWCGPRFGGGGGGGGGDSGGGGVVVVVVVCV